jgi:hypothetical protein
MVRQPKHSASLGRNPESSVSATCVCGSDLWPYRGIQPIAEPSRGAGDAVGFLLVSSWSPVRRKNLGINHLTLERNKRMKNLMRKRSMSNPISLFWKNEFQSDFSQWASDSLLRSRLSLRLIKDTPNAARLASSPNASMTFRSGRSSTPRQRQIVGGRRLPSVDSAPVATPWSLTPLGR